MRYKFFPASVLIALLILFLLSSCFVAKEEVQYESQKPVAVESSVSDSKIDSYFPSILNLSVENAIARLNESGYYISEPIIDQKHCQSIRNSAFTKFTANIPASATYFSFSPTNTDSDIPRVTVGFLVILDNRVIAYQGHWNVTSEDYGTDTFLKSVDRSGLGYSKYTEPYELKVNGVKHDGTAWEYPIYRRILYEFENGNFQFDTIQRTVDEIWQEGIPFDFLCLAKEFTVKEKTSENNLSAKEETKATSLVATFEQAPFNTIDIKALTKRENWYDNGIFSAYVDAILPNRSWEYVGLMNGEINPNPYSYSGYDVYCIEQQAYFVVPYSEYVAVPIVYAYDQENNSIKMVFNNGDIIE